MGSRLMRTLAALLTVALLIPVNSALALALLEPSDTPEPFALVEGDAYVVNTNTQKFHLPSCRYVDTIYEENRFDSGNSFDTLVKLGFAPCKICLKDHIGGEP